MTAGSAPFEALAGLEPVSLAELDATAALLTRRDRKYVVPAAVASVVLQRLAGSCRVLEIDGRRAFRYASVYFDTPRGASYLGAAYRRRHRWKVRTRSYVDAGRCLLEIKTRDPRGETVKERRDHPSDLSDSLDPTALAFLEACPLIGDAARRLQPVLTTRYTRATLLVGDGGARVTIDLGLEAATPDGRTVRLDDMAIVETKSGGAPSEADRVLWALGHRPARVSKFCTSLAALHPELPSNRWARSLRGPWLMGDVPAPGAVPRVVRPGPVRQPAARLPLPVRLRPGRLARRRPVLAA